MAKQTVSPIEQHVEKTVLGAAALAMIAVSALYLFSSPNKIEVDGASLGPRDIGNKLRQTADGVRTALTRGDYDPGAVVNYEEQLIQTSRRGPVSMVPWIPPALPVAGVWGMPVPDVGDRESGKSTVALTEVIPCGKPVASSGRSYGVIAQPIDLTPGATGEGSFMSPAGAMGTTGTTGLTEEERRLRLTLGLTDDEDIQWVTVAASFDLATQRQTMRKHGYNRARSGVHLTRFELQRQSIQADGSWSAWEDVQTHVPVKLPTAPTIVLGENGQMSPAQWNTLRYYYQVLVAEQERITQPPFPVTQIVEIGRAHV